MDDDDAGLPGFGPDTDQLVVELYDDLRQIARREHFRAGTPGTLQTTALVGEAYLKLRRRADWQGRSHFLACAATAMRHVLIDGARARLRGKRTPPPPGDPLGPDAPGDAQLVRLGDALAELARVDPELARIVDCRFFAGYDEAETARVMGISDRTVRRRWTRARALIHAEMAEA